MKTRRILIPKQDLLIAECDTGEILEILARAEVIDVDYKGKIEFKPDTTVKVEIVSIGEADPLPVAGSEPKESPIPF